MVSDETRATRPARELVLARLLEVLLIEALRATGPTAAAPSLLRGLADPRLAIAIRRMHERPDHGLTVAELAGEAALSRSTFFERFRRAVGLAPMEYLLTGAWRWRRICCGGGREGLPTSPGGSATARRAPSASPSPATSEVRPTAMSTAGRHERIAIRAVRGDGTMTTLLVAGATGFVGGLVLAQAIADTRVDRVVALTRRPIAAAGKLENVVIDFGELPEHAVWWKVDGVVAALGTTRADTPSRERYRAIDHDYPLVIARHARAAGATRFALVSSIGADPESRFAYPRLKGELEAALAGLGYPSLTIVRPSMLAGSRQRARAGEGAALTLFRLLAPVLPPHLRASPAAAVAAALLEGAIAGLPGTHVITNAEMT